MDGEALVHSCVPVCLCVCVCVCVCVHASARLQHAVEGAHYEALVHSCVCACMHSARLQQHASMASACARMDDYVYIGSTPIML